MNVKHTPWAKCSLLFKVLTDYVVKVTGVLSNCGLRAWQISTQTIVQLKEYRITRLL